MLSVTTYASWEEAGKPAQKKVMSTERTSSGLVAKAASSAWDAVKLIFTRDSVARERIFQDYKAGVEADRIRQEEREAGADTRIDARMNEAMDAAFARARAKLALESHHP